MTSRRLHPSQCITQELAADEPQVLILDDVLVNTDPVRQERILDVLAAQATHLQIPSSLATPIGIVEWRKRSPLPDSAPRIMKFTLSPGSTRSADDKRLNSPFSEFLSVQTDTTGGRAA